MFLGVSRTDIERRQRSKVLIDTTTLAEENRLGISKETKAIIAVVNWQALVNTNC
ncbi:hypothetical protein BABINDRAFT_162997, partial [Babjeviella inositovora NRRL Y-12698]